MCGIPPNRALEFFTTHTLKHYFERELILSCLSIQAAYWTKKKKASTLTKYQKVFCLCAWWWHQGCVHIMVVASRVCAHHGGGIKGVCTSWWWYQGCVRIMVVASRVCAHHGGGIKGVCTSWWWHQGCVHFMVVASRVCTPWWWHQGYTCAHGGGIKAITNVEHHFTFCWQ